MPINALSSKILGLQLYNIKSGNAQSRGTYGVDSSELGRMAAELYNQGGRREISLLTGS